ncbi:MAG: hypothetical protein NT018_00055 [Armatimonadetes bacterium]|nr:hypothetical protein [Armatimonadota bacterium]
MFAKNVAAAGISDILTDHIVVREAVLDSQEVIQKAVSGKKEAKPKDVSDEKKIEK